MDLRRDGFKHLFDVRVPGFPQAEAASLDKFEGRPPFKFTSSKRALLRTYGVRPVFHHASLTAPALSD